MNRLYFVLRSSVDYYAGRLQSDACNEGGGVYLVLRRYLVLFRKVLFRNGRVTAPRATDETAASASARPARTRTSHAPSRVEHASSLVVCCMLHGSCDPGL